MKKPIRKPIKKPVMTHILFDASNDEQVEIYDSEVEQGIKDYFKFNYDGERDAMEFNNVVKVYELKPVKYKLNYAVTTIKLG